VLQNTSDQGATRDGHKGPGYQVQLAETCDAANDVQLIVAAIPQTAAEQDPNAVRPVLDILAQNDVMPEVLFADTLYGSDENVQKCESNGVEMVSPTPGQKSGDAYAINSDDFVIAEDSPEVECCPRGETPLETIRDDAKGTTLVVMSATSCDTCPHRAECPVKCRPDGNYEYRFTDKQRRLDSRRREEATDVFRERYRKRSGIEATNSMLKRVMGTRSVSSRNGYCGRYLAGSSNRETHDTGMLQFRIQLIASGEFLLDRRIVVQQLPGE